MRDIVPLPPWTPPASGPSARDFEGRLTCARFADVREAPVPAPVSAVCSAHRRPELPAAAFPPGSVTAAPKSRALRIIEELETAPRGSYCGGIDRAEGVLRFGTGGAANSHGSLGDFLTTVGAHLRLTLRLTHHVSQCAPRWSR